MVRAPSIYWHWTACAEGQRALLDPGERARCEAFGSAERRRSFVAGRTALKTLMARCTGQSPGTVRIHVAADGSLDVAGPRYASLAHSGDWAVAAQASVPVGIDLEQIQPRDAAVARFLFAPTDRDTLHTLPGTESERLVLAWTLKEAVLKARRSGFRCSPKHIQLHVDAAARTACAVVTRTPPHDRWHLTFGRRHGCWWAWAVPSG